MNKTRNLLVLKGSATDVDYVLRMIQFKGLTVFPSSMEVTPQSILHEFSNNKSVLCCCVPEEFYNVAIHINVINSPLIKFNEDKNCINIASELISKQFETITNRLKLDIGDCKSNSSGLNGIPKKADCPYCVYFANNTNFAWDNLNRPIYKSENFFVMPTVGEFIKGYLLVIPAEHVMSIAEMNLNYREELLNVISDIELLLKLTYPITNVLVWENGTGNSGKGKAKTSIVHSHVHMAPSNLTATSIQDIQKFPLKKISYDELFSYGNHSYLLIRGSYFNEWWITDCPDLYIPRQHIRQLVADEYELEGDCWNWRTNPFVYLINATVNDIQNAIIKNWDLLPARIKVNTKCYLCN